MENRKNARGEKKMKFLFILIFCIGCLEAKKSIFDFTNQSPASTVVQNLILNPRTSNTGTGVGTGTGTGTGVGTGTGSAIPFTLPTQQAPTSTGDFNAFTVRWLAATGTNITYKLYRKKDSNFDSISQVESGNLITTTTNLEHIVTDELSGNGNYYNVIASDGNRRIVYVKFRLETASPSRIFLFAINGTTNGAMGGLAGANAMCEATRTATFANDFVCSRVRALISVSGDELINAPSTNKFVATREVWGVHTSTKAQTKVCNDWASCFPNLIISVNTPHTVLGIPQANLFTFSNTLGNVGTNTCSNGTSSNMVVNGSGAYSDSINNWVNTINFITCDNILKILCICY